MTTKKLIKSKKNFDQFLVKDITPDGRLITASDLKESKKPNQGQESKSKQLFEGILTILGLSALAFWIVMPLLT